MRNNRSKSATSKTKVLVVTADAAFEEQVRATFGAAAQIDLAVLPGTLVANEAKIKDDDVTVVVIDLDTNNEEEFSALTRLMSRVNAWPPVVVVTPSFDKDTARQLLQMRVADFLVKPVQPVELVRTCARRAGAECAGADRGADFHLSARGRRRRRHHARDPDRAAAAQQRPRQDPARHLPGRPRLPARRLRRLSRPRAAARSQARSSRAPSASTASCSR